MTCNHLTCQQSRNCPNRKEIHMLTLYRLFRFHRRSGMSVRQAIVRAWVGASIMKLQPRK